MAFAELMQAFRNGIGAPNPAAGPTPPAAIPLTQAVATTTAVGTTTAPNGVVPGTGSPGEVKTGLALFDGLWDTPVAKEGDTGPVPLFNASPESLLATARKKDFRPQLSQEQAASIAKGGEGAVATMLELMNDMTQQAYATGAHASVQLIEGALNKSQFAKTADIGKHIKRSNVAETLRADNPLFSTPAVAPIMEALQSQFLQKHPDATSAEIAQLARDYFGSVVETFTAPQRAAQATKESKGSTDWSKF